MKKLCFVILVGMVMFLVACGRNNVPEQANDAPLENVEANQPHTQPQTQAHVQPQTQQQTTTIPNETPARNVREPQEDDQPDEAAGENYAEQVREYIINAFSMPYYGGSVAGMGTFSYGEVVTLTATPNDGWSFYSWEDGHGSWSTDLVFSFLATHEMSNSRRTFSAVFVPDVVAELPATNPTTAPMTVPVTVPITTTPTTAPITQPITAAPTTVAPTTAPATEPATTSAATFAQLPTLPNRRITANELATWIEAYQYLGGILEFEREVLRLVNIERQNNGLNQLTMNTSVAMAARFKSQEMSNLNYFSHESPVYGAFNMIARDVFDVDIWSENIASGQRSPQEVMAGWMNSPGHRANILNTRWTEMGVGFYNNLWTQKFR